MRLRPRSSAILLTLFFSAHDAFSAGHGFSQGQETSAGPSTEVCESRTINYITHTLPQQCLRTAWSTANSTVHNGATSTTGTSAIGAATETATATAGETSTHGGNITESTANPEATPKQNATEEKKGDGLSEDSEARKEVEDAEDLATSSFMSFEEWKAMMLKKSGQDPADLRGRKHQENREHDPSAHEGLDSWDDDGEIALDFDVLSDKISEMAATASARSPTVSPDVSNVETQEPATYDDGVAHYRRPKDAGKTCKERFSYSSFDGGATVLKTSPGAQNAKAILVENKDSYMLFTCAQKNKFVIVELSEDILVDTVVLANFEFFSSMIRSFRISVSDKYPVKIERWKDLGTFQARNSRDIQSFLIENPKIWAKYIRIEFLSHYGNEYYCPVSLLRVHGTRMLDSWKDAEHGSEDDESAEIITSSEAVLDQEPAAENAPSAEPETTTFLDETAPVALNESARAYGLSPWLPPFFSESSLETCQIGTPTPTETTEVSPSAHAANDSTPPLEPASSTDNAGQTVSFGESTVSSTTSLSVLPASVPSSSAAIPANTPVSSTSTVPVSSGTDTAANATQSSQPTKPTVPKSSITLPKSHSPSKATHSPSSKSSTKHSTTGQSSSSSSKISNQNKTSSSTTSSAQSSPTIQESFFKSVSKRLQFLESNTTLSLQYIEDQSKFLQEALQKMERKHASRVDAFLDNLNNTVLSELRNVRQQYDQIWQSTVLALETQREQSQREVIALSSRLNLLADEVVFQKRMAIVQSIVLLCCLVLVVFSRGVLGGVGVAVVEQWPAGITSTSQFINSYLGSPRWPPGSPPDSRSKTPKHHRRKTTNSVRDHGGSLHPDDRQVPAPNAPPTRSVSYTDKVLPLTPSSEYFDNNDNDGSTPTPPKPPMIRIDEPEAESDEIFEEVQSGGDGDENDSENSTLGFEKAKSAPDVLLSPQGSAPDGAPASAEVRDVPVESDEVDADDRDEPPSKPPLTRLPLPELGGSSRKPLPALPEDST